MKQGHRSKILLTLSFSLLWFSINIYAAELSNDHKFVHLGTVVPQEIVEIVSPAKAKIEKNLVRYGDKVKKGDLLVYLHDDKLDLLCRTAQNKQIQAQLKLNELKFFEQGFEVNQAKNMLHRAKSRAEQALIRFNESTKLYKIGIISKNEYLTDKSVYEEGRQNLADAETYLIQLRTRAAAEVIQMQELEVENLTYELYKLEKLKQDLIIKAPISGVILKPKNSDKAKILTSGTYVDMNEALFLIGGIEALGVEFSLEEDELTYVSIGQAVRIKLPFFADHNFLGTMVFIDSQANEQDKHAACGATFTAKALLILDPELAKKVYFGTKAEVNLTRVDFAPLEQDNNGTR